MISDHEAKAMGHSKIIEFHKFFSEYQIWFEVGSERFRVKIRVYETSDGRYYFVQSHYVHAPNREGGSTTTNLSHATPHLALHTAVESITTYYDDSVAEGQEPSLSWFIANEHF